MKNTVGLDTGGAMDTHNKQNKQNKQNKTVKISLNIFSIFIK